MTKRSTTADATGRPQAPHVRMDLGARLERRRDLSKVAGYQDMVSMFRDIRIVTPRLQRIQRAINELRADARAAGNGEKYVLPVVGPSQSGKSTALRDYIQTVVASEKHTSGSLPALYVSLSSGCSQRQFQADLLSALVADEHDRVDPLELRYGTEAIFRRRVRENARLRRTEVAMIDETQHLVRGTTPEAARRVADSIRTCVIDGVAAFIIAGVEEVWPIFRTADKQLPLRCRDPIFMTPLDFTLKDEALQFRGFCAMFDRAMAESGLTGGDSGLAEGDIPACLWEVCSGFEGRVAKLIRQAWELAVAIEEPVISRELLAEVTDRWAMPLGLSRHNPFRDGVRDLRVIKSEWPSWTLSIFG